MQRPAIRASMLGFRTQGGIRRLSVRFSTVHIPLSSHFQAPSIPRKYNLMFYLEPNHHLIHFQLHKWTILR
jgi:hypothetical protein